LQGLVLPACPLQQVEQLLSHFHLLQQVCTMLTHILNPESWCLHCWLSICKVEMQVIEVAKEFDDVGSKGLQQLGVSL
jgi:hypothetical protein